MGAASRILYGLRAFVVNMPATDAEIAATIRAALAAHAAAGGTGVVSVTVDGTTTQYDAKAAREQLEFHEARAARADGTRPMIRTLDLRGAW